MKEKLLHARFFFVCAVRVGRTLIAHLSEMDKYLSGLAMQLQGCLISPLKTAPSLENKGPDSFHRSSKML